MPEVIIIGEKDQAKPAHDRDFGTRGERRKVETEELARCPVPGVPQALVGMSCGTAARTLRYRPGTRQRASLG
jgi:hypothetical protein